MLAMVGCDVRRVGIIDEAVGMLVGAYAVVGG